MSFFWNMSCTSSYHVYFIAEETKLLHTGQLSNLPKATWPAGELGKDVGS